MNRSKLHYITNGHSEKDILEEVASIVDAGCQWIQLRIKDETLNFEAIALKVKDICRGKAVFLVNDKVDIAQRINADGVHLGLEDMPIPTARAILGNTKIIGGTANTLADCLMHQTNGADYIGLGPFRNTVTKKKLSPIIGLSGYQEIMPKSNSKVHIPVVAIGGIMESDIQDLLQTTSVDGIAVSGLISNSNHKRELIGRLHAALELTKQN